MLLLLGRQRLLRSIPRAASAAFAAKLFLKLLLLLITLKFPLVSVYQLLNPDLQAIVGALGTRLLEMELKLC